MADHLSTTSRSRELGFELRCVREQAGFHANELAMRLKWSNSKICRLEKGRVDTNIKDVTAYLVSCGVVSDELDRILAIVGEPDTLYRLKPYTDGVPDNQRSLAVEEGLATYIQGFEPNFVPGLTQTRECAEALFREGGSVPTIEIDHWVQVRMDRQDVLREVDPPECVFYVHENALRDQVGSAKIMHEQMLWLLFLDSRPYCDIRVVPRCGGRGKAINDFRIMEYVDNNPVIYVETETAALYFENRPNREHYCYKLERIDQVALDKVRSREFLERLADDYDRTAEPLRLA